MLQDSVYKYISALCVFIALFLHDFSQAVLSKNEDPAKDIILFITFIALVTDMTLQCVAYSHYVKSFFFWLDLLGTITLLADIGLTYSIFGTTYADFTIARGGRAGRAARSAASFRLSKVVLWARVARLVRIARVVRVTKNVSEAVITDKARGSILDKQLKDANFILDSRRNSVRNSFVRSSIIKNNKQQPKQSLIKTKVIEEQETDTSDEDYTDTNNSSNNTNNDNIEVIDEEEFELDKQHDDPSEPLIVGEDFVRAQTIQEVENDSYRIVHSSKVGMRVADSITRFVVAGILLTVSLVPLLSAVQEESYSSLYYAISLFNAQSGDSTISQDALDLSISTFINEWDDTGVLKVIVDNTVYHTVDQSTIDNLRDTEKLQVNDGVSSIILSIEEQTRFESGMSIAFTIVIVFLFAILAFSITHSVRQLVVAPIERMTGVVQEFTKNVCLLAGDMESQNRIVTELMETEVLEAAIETLSSLFDGISKKTEQMKQQFQNSDLHSDDKDRESSVSMSDSTQPFDYNYQHGDVTKALDILEGTPTSLLAPKIIHDEIEENHERNDKYVAELPKKKTTTILKSRHSTIAINIQEKKVVNITEAQIQDKIRQLHDSGDIDSFYIRATKYNELKSVQATMLHPIAVEYFRHYCKKQLAMESFEFVQIISEYHDVLYKEFRKVFDQFISHSATKRVSMNSSDYNRIKTELKELKFTVRSFDKVRKEIISSLAHEIYPNFIKSHYAMAYVKSIEENAIKFQHLNLQM